MWLTYAGFYCCTGLIADDDGVGSEQQTACSVVDRDRRQRVPGLIERE